jgi:IS30 family transposase
MKTKKFTYLSNAERSEIEILRGKGYSTRKIGKVLRRSHNTVAYELRRCPSGYRAALGKQYARTNLKNRRFQWRKINEHTRLREYIVKRLEKGWNPHEIAGRMKWEQKEHCISAVSIYDWLLRDIRGNRHKNHLYMFRRNRRSHRKRGLHGRIQGLVSIHERPNIKDVPGHWETDLVVSNRSGSGAISTSNEKVSRYFVADYVPDTTSCAKQKTLHRLEREFNVKSITFDRGH